MFCYVNIFHVEVSVLVFVLCSFIVDAYHVIEMYLRDLWHRVHVRHAVPNVQTCDRCYDGQHLLQEKNIKLY